MKHIKLFENFKELFYSDSDKYESAAVIVETSYGEAFKNAPIIHINKASKGEGYYLSIKSTPYDADTIRGENYEDLRFKTAEEAIEAFDKNKYGEIVKKYGNKSAMELEQVFTDELVPSQGKSKTVEGEMLRAFQRIEYRYNNDGDYFYEGYGAETAGPAYLFLIRNSESMIDGYRLKTDLESIAEEQYKEDIYVDTLNEAKIHLLVDIVLKNGNYRSNNTDMYSYTDEAKRKFGSNG